MYHNGKTTLTGGSDIFNSKWSTCDKPIRTPQGNIAPQQHDIEANFGIYLLARCKVNNTFTYYRRGNLIIVQTRKDFRTEPQDHIFMSSLVKLLCDYHDEQFVFDSPYQIPKNTKPHDVPKVKEAFKERLIRIHRNVFSIINSLEPKKVGKPDQYGKYKTVPVSTDQSRLYFVL